MSSVPRAADLDEPGSDPDEPGTHPGVSPEDPWLTLGEAGRLTGKHPDTLRVLARRGQLPARKGNRGAWMIQVPARMLPGGGPEPRSVSPEGGPEAEAELVGELREEVAELRVALARAEAGRDAAVAQVRAEGEARAAQAEAERDAATRIAAAEVGAMRGQLEQVCAALAKAEAQADRLEAALAEARRPWLVRVLDGLRWR